jgi:hypothetical protein
MAFETEREFTLPKGYLDDEGRLHRQGTIRLATAADEILPLRDHRVQQNPAYLSILVLSRVVTKLGELGEVTPKVVEGLYASDLSYLQTLYEEMNGGGGLTADAVCPKCDHAFEVTLDPALPA